MVAGELMRAKSAKGGKSQPQNFDAMKTTMDRIIKVQAWFRKMLTLRRLEKQMRDHKAATMAKKSSDTPEEQALREFTQQLSNKSITPEGFFRICDSDFKGTISAATFKEQIQKLGVKLSRGQLSRIILILDEDMEGTITRQEYYDALEAFNVSGEKHKSFDGSIYHPFEHKCLFKLISELKRKNIDFLEMYNACDVNDDNRVTIDELQKFAEGLSPDMKQKEVHALMNYLDIDKNGIVDKDEFLRQLNKGEQTYRQTQMLNRQIAERKQAPPQGKRLTGAVSFNKANADNFFQEEEMTGGDQAFAPDEPVRGKGSSAVQDKPPIRSGQEPSDPEEKRRKQLIEKMEKEGQNFTAFFQKLKQISQDGLIPLGSVLKALEAAYPTITSNDRNSLVKSFMSRGKVDYIGLEGLFMKYAKNLKPSVSQTFSILANNIILKMGQGAQPVDSIKQFLRAMDASDPLSEIEFQELFSGRVKSVSKQDLDQAFKSIDADMDGFIDSKDLVDVLLSYTEGSKPTLNVKEMSSVIPGFESMSPRTRCEELVSFITNELDKKSMRALNVYKMADVKNQGSVPAQSLIQSFQKILPNIKKEIFEEAFTAFRLRNLRDSLSRSDFEAVFVPQTGNGQSSSASNFKGLASVSPQKPKSSTSDEDEALKWIRKLDNAMLRESVSPGVAFKAADINHNGVVTVDELKQSFKRLIPDDSLPLVELKKIMMAFDANRNGMIEEQEFIDLIEKARNTNVVFLESPQKQRAANDNLPDSRGLPLRNAGAGQRNDENPIELVVENLDSKLNLKKFFGDIPINDKGVLTVAQVGRRFKAAQTKDGKTLAPSEYIPVIKALDPTQQGSFSVKDTLKFLENYSQSKDPECVLELKYIANFIEFQAQSRSTKTFIMNNSKLQPNKRLLEIELMSELSKMFGISMQVGKLIFNQLQAAKGKGDVTLEELGKQIDQYRVVQVEDVPDKKVTPSQKLDPSKVLYDFVVKLMGFSPRRRDQINAQIADIEQRERCIPYKDFFDFFVTDLQMLGIPESKALYEHLRALGNKNVVMADVFSLQIQKVQDQIQEAQDKASGKSSGANPATDAKAKRKMNEQNPNAMLDGDSEFAQDQQQNNRTQKKTGNPPQARGGASEGVSANNRELDPHATEVVLKLEAQMGHKLEDVAQPIFEQDQLATLSFQRLLMQSSGKVDKTLAAQVCQLIDKDRSSRIQVKDFFYFIRGVNGKYSQEQVLAEVAEHVEEPVQKSLQNQGIVASESYNKNDFYDCLSQVANITHFHCLCLFFDLLGDQEESLSGKIILQKIIDAKKQLSQKDQKGIDRLNDSREEKKNVRFEQTQRNKDEDMKACQLFIQSYGQVSLPATIESALKKLIEFLKPVKTIGDALSKFDSSGKGLIGVQQFFQKLDQIPQMTKFEKLAGAFLAINQNKDDILEVNVSAFIKLIKQVNLTPTQVKQNQSKLQINYEAIMHLTQVAPKGEVKKEESKSGIVGHKKTFDEMHIEHDKMVAKKLPIILPGLMAVSKDPKKSAAFMLKFEKAVNQKLSYKQFKDYILDELKIKTNDDEIEVFTDHVDEEEIGKVQLCDLINFFKRFNIPIESKNVIYRKVEVDAREAKGMHLKCEKLEYTIVPERDYFIPGKTTILNGEKAALVMAEKLYNELRPDEEYFDKEFGPKDENDKEGSRLSIYCTGEPPKGYVDPESIEWIRPEEITEETPMFFDDGPAPNDVKQGKLGDCWFIGALSVIATRDDLLRGGIGNIELGPDFEVTQEIAEMFSIGVYPPLFHYYRKKGIYVFRFFKEFNWRYVIIDDRIPCFSYNSKPVFGQCQQLHEIWVPLLEKAYAKIHGCYETLISGFIDDALSDMTGLVAEKLQLHNENGIFPHRTIKDKDTFWQYLMGLSTAKEKSMMGCSVVGDTEREIIQDGFKTGIMTGHAYGIIDTFEVNSDVRPHKLLRIRNPWGNMEWKGKWSDGSDECQQHLQVLQEQYIDKLPEDERFHPGDDDGMFLINYQSWREIFNNMYVCLDFPAEWSALRFRSKWDSTCSGGVPSPMTPENMKRWAQNPQYLLDTDEDIEIFISLAQQDGRAKRPDGKYLKFPYGEAIYPMLFTVCKLPQGKTKLEAFDKNLVVGASVLKQHKEVSLRLKLTKGKYVIVPATRNPGQYGDFTLSIYVSMDEDDYDLTRIDKPEEEYTLIQEETERYDNVEDWKIDLTEKRIKYMIVEDDILNPTPNQSTSFANQGMKLSQAMERASVKKSPTPNTVQKKNISFEHEDAFPDDDVIE